MHLLEDSEISVAYLEDFALGIKLKAKLASLYALENQVSSLNLYQ